MECAKQIRPLFPQLSEKVYGKPLVYLDNAATSLRLATVIDKWDDISARHTSNLHRAVHATTEFATAEFESTREAVRAFVGAESADEIIFTSGATGSLNLAAFSFCEAFVKEGDEILVSEAEHHSNLIPWLMACKRKGASVTPIPVTESGHIDLEALKKLVSGRCRIACVAHVSNVLGLVNPIREIADICHAAGVTLLVDGAQGIVHEKVDVKALDCDFYAFSGHKMYAAPGTGVLYGKRALLEKLPPYMGGGEMMKWAKMNGFESETPPHRFEAGTQNISGVPTLKPAIEFMKSLPEGDGLPVSEIIQELSDIEGLTLYGIPHRASEKVPLFSFSVEGAHHEDLALILDKMGIAVRSGQMCAEPLMDKLGVTGLLRASFAPYNTMEEAEYFVNSLRKAIKMLKR